MFKLFLTLLFCACCTIAKAQGPWADSSWGDECNGTPKPNNLHSCPGQLPRDSVFDNVPVSALDTARAPSLHPPVVLCNQDMYTKGDLFLDGAEVVGRQYFTAEGNIIAGAAADSVCAGHPISIPGSFVLSNRQYRILLKGGWRSDTADVDLRAGRNHRIRLTNGFRALSGSYLHAYIEPQLAELVFEDDFDSSWENNWKALHTAYFNWGSNTSCNAEVDELNLASQVSNHSATVNFCDTTSPITSGCLDIKTEQIAKWGDVGNYLLDTVSRGWGDTHIVRRNLLSGRIATKDPITVRNGMGYGRYDIRAKVPTDNAMFPAIWMARDSFGEIDIMEHINGAYFCRNFFVSTLHPPINNFKINQDVFTCLFFPGQDSLCTDISAAFHTYSLEWLPGTIRILFDGRVVARFPFNNATSSDTNLPRHHDNVRLFPGKGLHMLLNTAIEAGYKEAKLNVLWDTTLVTPSTPKHMLVDYVKVRAIDATAGPSASKRATDHTAPLPFYRPAREVPQFDVQIFPNPSRRTGMMNYSISSNEIIPEEGTMIIVLYDLLGHEMARFTKDASSSKGTFTLPDLNYGRYICKFTIQNGQFSRTSSKVLVLNK